MAGAFVQGIKAWLTTPQGALTVLGMGGSAGYTAYTGNGTENNAQDVHDLNITVNQLSKTVEGIAQTQAQQTKILEQMAKAQVGSVGSGSVPNMYETPPSPASDIAPAPPGLAMSFTQACMDSLSVQHQKLDPVSGFVTRTLTDQDKTGLCHTVVEGKHLGLESAAYNINLGGNFECSANKTDIMPNGAVIGTCKSVNFSHKEQVVFSASVPSGAGAGPQ